MSTIEIIGGVLLIIFSVAIVLLVLMQESPKNGGMSALGGGDSYYDRNQGRTMDALLHRATKFAAIGFFIVTLLVYAYLTYKK